MASPILVGRPAVLQQRIERYGLRLRLGIDVEVTNPEQDDRFHRYWTSYWEIMSRRGISKEMARVEMRRRPTLIGAMMLHLGDADGMICGTVGRYENHLELVDQVIGKAPGVKTYAAMNILLLSERSVALTDTHINHDPDSDQVAEITLAAARKMRQFNIEPKVALLSSSNFGTNNSPAAVTMRGALERVRQLDPSLEVDGEMHGDCALDEKARHQILPTSALSGEANLLVCPNVEAGNIAYNLLKTAAGGNVAIGPFLLGARAPVHIMTSTSSVRRIVNMTAVTVVDANVATEG